MAVRGFPEVPQEGLVGIGAEDPQVAQHGGQDDQPREPLFEGVHGGVPDVGAQRPPELHVPLQGPEDIPVYRGAQGGARGVVRDAAQFQRRVVGLFGVQMGL